MPRRRLKIPRRRIKCLIRTRDVTILKMFVIGAIREFDVQHIILFQIACKSLRREFALIQVCFLPSGTESKF